jgi:predicted aminopeptidase
MVLLASACAELRYYRQSASGQLDIVSRRQAIDSLVEDDSQNAELRERLARVRAVRAFAIEQLGLPDTGSYTQYADLERDYAVLGLYAAPEFSIDLKNWCYPVVGCAAYRGYFDRSMLTSYVEELRQQGYETYIAVVPAYSTLGWFNDPVLNTVLDWSEPQMAGLIFHELAHQQLYVKGDTVFNESFATAVERAGVERWLAEHNDHNAVEHYRNNWNNRQRVVDLIISTRHELDRLYQREMPEDAMRRAKQDVLEGMRMQYRALRQTMDADPGYDAWFAAELNNAKLGSTAAYHAYVEAFLILLEKHQQDYPAFYAEVARIGALSAEEREAVLARLALANADSELSQTALMQ